MVRSYHSHRTFWRKPDLTDTHRSLVLSSRGPRVLSVGTLCLLKSEPDTPKTPHMPYILKSDNSTKDNCSSIRQMTPILLKLRLHSKTPPHSVKGFPVRAKWAVSQEACTDPWCPKRAHTGPQSQLRGVPGLRELADLSLRPQKWPSSCHSRGLHLPWKETILDIGSGKGRVRRKHLWFWCISHIHSNTYFISIMIGCLSFQKKIPIFSSKFC